MSMTVPVLGLPHLIHSLPCRSCYSMVPLSVLQDLDRGEFIMWRVVVWRSQHRDAGFGPDEGVHFLGWGKYQYYVSSYLYSQGAICFLHASLDERSYVDCCYS